MGTELKREYGECVKNKRIKPFSDGPRLIGKELKVAKNDLGVAKKGLDDSQWKWSIIQAYYAMFHAARALLFAKSLNERSHYCLRIALEYHYGESSGFPQELIDAFQTARTMRENADYEENFSEIGAKKLVSAAERFIEEARKVLNLGTYNHGA